MADLKYDKKTSFIGADIRNIDWSKNPLLKRHIEDQQFLHAYKEKAKGNRPLKLWYILWGETCDYGRSFFRWLRYSLYLAFFFGSCYYKFSLIDIRGAKTFLTPWYYSIVTLTTLGFGDVVPKNVAGQILVILEVLLGYVMLGGLISIFANKLARRS